MKEIARISRNINRTYSCVNCLRTLPYLKAWNRAYGGKGLVIVGVHTPEFEFEKSPANVGRAIKDLGIAWPVVQDNDYEQWNAYANQYWPADYVVDADGNVRYFHFGEGDYDGSEDVIRTLLREAGRAVGKVSVPAYRVASGTPETYLGYARAQGFTSAVALVPDQAVDYRPAGAAGNPRNGRWSLSGRWTVTGEYAMPQASGSLELGFDAKNVFLVVEPQGAGGRVQVKVDGRRSADTPDVKDGLLVPGESRLYQLVGLADPGPHILRLDVTGSLRLFAFTFG